MKRIFLILGAWFLIFTLTGCASLQQIIQPIVRVEPTVSTQALPPYSGPKTRIAVADFDVKALKATGEIGSGLREMLIAALINSNRFSVLERQILEAVMEEQESPVSSIIISAAVTEFKPQTSGGRAGVGGGGGVGSGLLGGLSGAVLNKAHLALDICLIDTTTTEVLATTRVQGQASDISGAIMAGFLGNWSLGNGLSVYANTPMEKAIRICIIEAVRYIAQTTPASYYKY